MFDLLYLSWFAKFLLITLHTSHFCLMSEQANPSERTASFVAWAVGAWLCSRD